VRPDILPLPPVPSIDRAVSVWLGSVILQHGHRRELSFACGWDFERHAVTSARLIARGSWETSKAPASTIFPTGLVCRGELAVHQHPSTWADAPRELLERTEPGLNPSPQDLEWAQSLARDGIGFAIINDLATEILVVVEPSEPGRPQAPLGAMRACARWLGARLLAWGHTGPRW
jgi:hypothetical protein